jgi:hypothetical protein
MKKERKFIFFVSFKALYSTNELPQDMYDAKNTLYTMLSQFTLMALPGVMNKVGH